MEYEVGFLGYGHMARAISDGLDRSGLVPYHQQLISGRDRGRLKEAGETKGVAVADDNRALVRHSKVVLLGVLPNQVEDALEEVRNESAGRLIISMAAGVRLETLNSFLHTGAGLVRAMPNVAAQVGQGTTVICGRPRSDPAHLIRARQIFESVGLCLELEECLFDVASALSGAGPAYFFALFESFVRGAVRLGVPWEAARRLVVQTALGAAEMASRQPGQSLANMRDAVASPGGVTAEGLYVLDKGGLGGVLQEALEAATMKARRMA